MARLAFWDAVTDLALDRTLDKLTPEEREEENKLERVLSHYKNGQRYYTLKENPERTYDKLNGLSLREYWEKLENEIARNEPLVIYESFRLDTSYRYGIGLYIVIDAGCINRMVIEQAIDRFYEIGEKIGRQRIPSHGKGCLTKAKGNLLPGLITHPYCSGRKSEGQDRGRK
jgi:hypothetical protein